MNQYLSQTLRCAPLLLVVANCGSPTGVAPSEPVEVRQESQEPESQEPESQARDHKESRAGYENVGKGQPQPAAPPARRADEGDTCLEAIDCYEGFTCEKGQCQSPLCSSGFREGPGVCLRLPTGFSHSHDDTSGNGFDQQYCDESQECFTIFRPAYANSYDEEVSPSDTRRRKAKWLKSQRENLTWLSTRSNQLGRQLVPVRSGKLKAENGWFAVAKITRDDQDEDDVWASHSYIVGPRKALSTCHMEVLRPKGAPEPPELDVCVSLLAQKKNKTQQ